MKQVTFSKFTITNQCDDLSEIRDLFAVPLKLLRGPQGDRGPQFENHCSNCFAAYCTSLYVRKIHRILCKRTIRRKNYC